MEITLIDFTSYAAKHSKPHLFVANEGKEDVVEHLDAVDVQQPLRGRHVGEIHDVRGDPHRPRPRHCRHEVPERIRAVKTKSTR